MKKLTCFLAGCDCTGYACSRCNAHVDDASFRYEGALMRLMISIGDFFRDENGNTFGANGNITRARFQAEHPELLS